MKRFVLPLAPALLLAIPAVAGLQFEFRSETTGGGRSMTGVAVVDGENVRIDLSRGDGLVFPDGSVVLSTDGGRTLAVVDPKKKSWYELRLDETVRAAGSLLGALGGMLDMSIRGEKVDVTDLGPGETIEGYPTRKYRIRSTWTLDLTLLGEKSTFRYHNDTETWVTPKIPRAYATFVQLQDLRSGHPELDALIEAQTAGVDGFPLRQVTRATTTQGSKSETRTTTLEVTGIIAANPPASRFAIPPGFTKTASPLDALQNLGTR